MISLVRWMGGISIGCCWNCCLIWARAQNATDELGPKRGMGLITVDLPGPMDMGPGVGCYYIARIPERGIGL